MVKKLVKLGVSKPGRLADIWQIILSLDLLSSAVTLLNEVWQMIHNVGGAQSEKMWN